MRTFHTLVPRTPGPLLWKGVGIIACSWQERKPRHASDTRMMVVGLGVGTLASYRTPGQQWTILKSIPRSSGLRAPTRISPICGGAATAAMSCGAARGGFSASTRGPAWRRTAEGLLSGAGFGNHLDAADLHSGRIRGRCGVRPVGRGRRRGDERSGQLHLMADVRIQCLHITVEPIDTALGH